MVRDMRPEYHYTVADEQELDKLLSGTPTQESSLWDNMSKHLGLKTGTAGVVWAADDEAEGLARPLLLISHEEDIRWLCGRYAQLHSDLSPLTAWCHLLTPRFLEILDSLTRTPYFAQLQAAWTGLIIAEAALLAEKPVAQIRLASCLATQSYAIARTHGLWSHVPLNDVLRRFDEGNRLCRRESITQRGDSRLTKLRSCLEPLWQVMSAFSLGRNSVSDSMGVLVSALESLRRARYEKNKQEASHLIRSLRPYVMEVEALESLSNLHPEMRLSIFDRVVAELASAHTEHDKMRYNALALVAGYLATVAAGGSPSLSLAEAHATRWPEITAWAYLIGGIGENVVWTSSFDGLGRLVARELLRPLRLDEPPTCDFAFDEAYVLADPKLNDPLVHLRIKQARHVTVALLPGVNIAISIESTPLTQGKREQTQLARPASTTPAVDPLAAFADALWPYLQDRMNCYMQSAQRDQYGPHDDDSGRGRGKRKSGPQSNLPLGGSKRY